MLLWIFLNRFIYIFSVKSKITHILSTSTGYYVLVNNFLHMELIYNAILKGPDLHIKTKYYKAIGLLYFVSQKRKHLITNHEIRNQV